MSYTSNYYYEHLNTVLTKFNFLIHQYFFISIHNRKNNMEHETFINDVILHFQALDKFTPNRFMAIKDKDLKYIYVNAGFASVYGLNSERIIGKSELELERKFMTGYSAKEEHNIIYNNSAEYYLNISTNNNHQIPVVFSKTPITNPHSGNVAGILIECLDMNIFSVSRNICRQMEIPNEPIKAQKAIRLSLREQQAVFLFLANFNSQDIADIINKIEGNHITKNTIDSIFRNLFIKFDCANRVELFKRLIQYHFDQIIPKNILPECTIRLSRYLR